MFKNALFSNLFDPRLKNNYSFIVQTFENPYEYKKNIFFRQILIIV